MKWRRGLFIGIENPTAHDSSSFNWSKQAGFVSWSFGKTEIATPWSAHIVSNILRDRRRIQLSSTHYTFSFRLWSITAFLVLWAIVLFLLHSFSVHCIRCQSISSLSHWSGFSFTRLFTTSNISLILRLWCIYVVMNSCPHSFACRFST